MADTRPTVEQLREQAGRDQSQFRRLLIRYGYAEQERRCPEGRPLYCQGELPDTLATRTQLRRVHQRELADGQRPVATYYTALPTKGNRYHPLYEVAATVPRDARRRAPEAGDG